MLAKKLGLLYLDTGAMYRAVGLAVTRAGVSLDDHAGVAKIAVKADINLVGEPENLQIFLDGENVTDEIRTTEAGQAASIVSAISEVRRILVDHQRTLGNSSPHGAVLDGRDIGSVVFPNADRKYFLTAKPEARARRRFEEDVARGRTTSYETTFAEIRERDERDVSRADSPLTIAADAIVIDTSELELPEVFAEMVSHLGT
jgi:cytidylate kinase